MKYLTSCKILKIFASSYDRVAATQPDFVIFFLCEERNREQVSATPLHFGKSANVILFTDIKLHLNFKYCANVLWNHLK